MTDYPDEVLHRFHGTAEQMGDALVAEPPHGWRTIVIEDYDPAWVDRFARVSATLHDALGDLIIDVQHVGSTSVPGLAAKPIIDIDLLIGDSGQESRYLPALERIDYHLVLREPWWYGHRMLVDSAEDVHLHVWPRTAPEPVRHRLLRDWLRTHPDDRQLYASTKRRLAAQDTGDYTLAKSEVIDAIFGRIFAASGRETAR
jgi:GrpB-like predicted nucleotidyltransferase (UPF0157 family)